MKKEFLLWLIVLAIFSTNFSTFAQNAAEIINQFSPRYTYVAGSFLIDTGTSQANLRKRAFLVWGVRFDSLSSSLSLSEYDGKLNFLTEQGNTVEKFGSMLAKKIIKSRFERAYYLLAYVTNSNHKISGRTVFSSPVIFKIDAATLGLVWASKINLSVINDDTRKTVIEYNDLIETRDQNIVLVGKYGLNAKAKESVLATKLRGSTGVLIWRYVYKLRFNVMRLPIPLQKQTMENSP